MASVAPDGPPSTNKGKGKAVVSPEPTERTPLLPSSSSHVEAREGPEEPSPSEQRRLMSKLTVVFLISLFVSVVLFVLLALLAYSYASRAAAITPADVLDRALVLGDLHRIEVKNVTENGEITLEVEGRAGLDAGVLIGVKSDDEDGYFMRWWKAIGRWGLRKLDRVTVELSPVDLSSGDGAHLTTVVVQPLELPLTADAPPDSSWLTTISTTLLARPTQNTSIFGHFLRESWIHGAVTVLAALKDATVHGGGKDDAGWRSRFVFTRSDITTMTHIKIPPLRGLPSPGGSSSFPDISDLITIRSYGAYSESGQVLLHAEATAVNPFSRTFNFTIPMLPFAISLPSNEPMTPPIHVASVYNSPFGLTYPNITISVSGNIVPLPPSSAPVISNAISRYLSSKDNDVELSSPLFPGITIETVFPGPRPRPQVLRNVTIKDMKIHATVEGQFLASGNVYARAVLPKGVDVELDVHRIFPDLLVFDGEVPDDVDVFEGSEPGLPPPRPLPDPLPEKAFARLRPEDWVVAQSVADEREEDSGSIYIVNATVVDMPLEKLPGRGKVFRGFIAKVVFGSHGALAGLLGTAAVAVDVKGLPFGNGREIELTGLPFRGSVRIGKKLS